MRRLLVLTLSGFAVAATAAVASPPHAQLALRTTPLGRVLVDARGHTLYASQQDRGGKSFCTGGCSATWPPFVAVGKPVALKGLKASLLGTTKRSDGRMQVTFAHRPLYFFAGDAKAGQVNGAAMAHWGAVSAAGKLLHAQPSTADADTTPASTTPAPAPNYGGGDGY